MKTKQVRIGSIADDLAEKIMRALEDQDVITYLKAGPRLLDVYVETYIEEKSK